MRRTCVLINNSGLGGAERRLGRLFVTLVRSDEHSRLVVNAGLCRKLESAGVIASKEARVSRLFEPCGLLAKSIGLRSGVLSFWLQKLDYVLFACLLAVRYALARRRLFHLALGGVYVALPLMIFRPDHRFAISVTNRHLDRMVGVPRAVPIYRFALKRCTIVDALSEAVRADLVERGIAPEKIFVAPGSVVDLDHYRPAPLKENWVVFAGRLVEEKNPLLFLEAASTILEAVPSAKFYLMGEGPLRNQIEKARSRLELEGAVELGFRSDLEQVLSKARVFLSLQRQDNYPSQSLLEAMACGAVPVATDVGFTWQLVDETTGIRVKPDPEKIAEVVIHLLKDRQACDRLAQAARLRVAERHSEEAYGAYLDVLYARLDQGNRTQEWNDRS
ncbi:MAG: glycosyltransferase [Nitrospiraceae bacterium]